jgi:methyl-accepting chemotaxis protein
MAIRIAKKINIPENCIHKVHADLQIEVDQVLNWQHNAESILALHKDSAHIKDFADKIVSDLLNVKTTIDHYEIMTKDINKIASNIHIISLNASIEAARAGEHGRPFTVVAEAIHKLASETQKAILEITSTSEETKKAIEDISKMVGAIRSDITKSHDNISKLTNSTQQMLKTDNVEGVPG